MRVKGRPSFPFLSPRHTPPTPNPARNRLPCFLAITGPQDSVHAMQTRARASQPQPPTPPQPPRRQRPPPQDNTTPAVASKYRRCWDQLCRPNIRKADVAVAWRALHCQLRTPSFLAWGFFPRVLWHMHSQGVLLFIVFCCFLSQHHICTLVLFYFMLLGVLCLCFGFV